MAININVYGNDNVEEKIKYVYLQVKKGIKIVDNMVSRIKLEYRP